MIGVDGLAISNPRLGQSAMVVIEVTMAMRLRRLLSDQIVIEHGQRLRRGYEYQLGYQSEDDYLLLVHVVSIPQPLGSGGCWGSHVATW